MKENREVVIAAILSGVFVSLVWWTSLDFAIEAKLNDAKAAGHRIGRQEAYDESHTMISDLSQRLHHLENQLFARQDAFDPDRHNPAVQGN